MLSISQSHPHPALPTRFNMAAYVLAQADAVPDKAALEIVDTDGVVEMLTYHALKDAVLSTATTLLGHAKRGDRIIVQLGNTPACPVTYLAAIAVGIIPVMLSPELSAPEYARIVSEIEPALEVRAPLPPSNHHADFDIGDPKRPAYIVYTSGTSGRPMAVVHAHQAVWARRMMWDGWYGLKASDRMLHAGAFNWTFTLGTGLMDPWAIGATALIPVAGTKATELAPILARHKATLFAAAPGVYRRLLRGNIPKMPDLRHGLSAGEVLPVTIAAAWTAKTDTAVHTAFGMSECSTFISSAPMHPAPPSSAGFPQAGRRVAIVGAQGPLPIGEIGTIAIHRDDPGLMLGYLHAPCQTAARFQGDWFMTGDIGAMDATGAITYAGRNDDMMNAGGHRVSPLEVEHALTAHPQINEVAACTVQVRTGVFVIAAFYVSADVIDEEELATFARAHLATYKVPRLFVAVEALARGANNKLLRAALRTQWETAHGQA